MMTIYLWHLTALSLLGAAGIFVLDGWLFSFEPGSAAWWAMRAPFLSALAVVTLGLIAVFGKFEHSLNDSSRPRTRSAIAWAIPVVAVAGAAVLRAVPKRPTTQPKMAENPGPSGRSS